MTGSPSLTQRCISALLCVSISVYPWHASLAAQQHANTPPRVDIQPRIETQRDSQRETGLAGQAHGHTLRQQASTPALVDGVIHTQDGSDIPLTDLFPGSGGDLSSLTKLYNNHDALATWSDSAQQSLQTGSGVNSMAYHSVRDTQARSRPNLRNDPLWAITDAVQTHPEWLQATFPACDVATPSPIAQYCDRPALSDSTCVVEHHYQVGIIEHDAGPLNLRRCGEGCLEVWLGKVADNYWEGQCSIFEDRIQLRVINPDAIERATLSYAKWDDHMQVWIGDDKVWSGPDASFPPETPGECERNTNWEVSPSRDVTSYFQALAPNSPLAITTRVSVTGKGEGYARITIHYDPQKLVSNDTWSPPRCLATAERATASAQCEDLPTRQDGCTTVNGVRVCETHFSPPPIQGVSPFCRRVNVIDQRTASIPLANPHCQTLEQREDCGYISSACSLTDNDGHCVRFTDRFDCQLNSMDPQCVVSDLFPSEFSGCRTVTTVTSEQHDYHIPDTKFCERITPMPDCELRREVNIAPINQSFPFARACFSELVLSYTAPHADTLLEGHAQLELHHQHLTHADISQQPTADNQWTTQVTLTGNQAPVALSEPAMAYPILVCRRGTLFGSMCRVTDGERSFWEEAETDIGYRCKTGWTLAADNTCHTEVLRCAGNPQLVGTLTVTGKYLHQTLTHTSDDPDIDRCLLTSDGFSEVDWQCTDTSPKPIADGNTSRWIGTTELALLPALYPTSTEHEQPIAKQCWHANASYTADRINTGESAPWIDWQGNEHTITHPVSGAPTNNCEALAQREDCQWVASECISGAQGHDNYCYVRNERYDCGTTVNTETLRQHTEYQCDGEIRCMGHDCLQPQHTPPADFAKAAALLQAAELMTSDIQCDANTGQANVNCHLFKGEAGTCKKAVAGIVNCCEKPQNVSLGHYLQLITQVSKLDTTLMALPPDNAVHGAWQTLRQPISSAWSELKQPFTSAWDSLLGATPDSMSTGVGASHATTGMMQDLTNQTAQWVGDTFGQSTQSALFDSSGGNFQLGGQVGSALGTIMSAYMIYSITVLIVQLIWRCEQKEFEMNTKRTLKSCHYVGSYCNTNVLGACLEKRQSYCCFNSPLSRILQEQARPQLHMSWGTAKSPQCQGFTPAQVNQINWQQIDFSEWIALLALGGQLPNLADINLDQLTGQGSSFNTNGLRQNASERPNNG